MKAIDILKAFLNGYAHEDDETTEAIKELEELQKDNQRLKILFDSEFCRCSNCHEYKRTGFGCYCENKDK